MTLPDMDKDLSTYTDFEQLSNRVGYWTRRFKLTNPSDDDVTAFDAIVAKHGHRVRAVLRAG